MFCPKCGNEVAAGTAYCGNCGQKMDALAPAAPTNVPEDQALLTPAMFCPKCGNPIFDRAAACPGCGWTEALSDRGTGSAQVQAVEWTRQRIKRLVLIFGICIAVLLFLVIRSAESGDITGDWENSNGDAVVFYEDGVCEMAGYTLEAITGYPVEQASRLMYDLKFGKKIEFTYVMEYGMETVRVEYDIEKKNGVEYLTLGTQTFARA